MPTYIFAVICFCLVMPETAFAYLDPGTGSMLLQLLLAGLAGAAVVCKFFWQQISRPFSRGGKEEAEGTVELEDSSDPNKED